MAEKEEVNIEYKKSFVAFLDVLGFKEMVKKDNRKKINDYFDKVNLAFSILKKNKTIKDVNYIIISDSIILTITCESENDKVENLVHLCRTVNLIQKSLACNDIWIRGAISYGDTYFKDNQIVGSAYIDAYLLEQKAIYPRVILDSRLINDLKLKNSGEFVRTINSKAKKLNSNIIEILYDWNKRKNYIEQDLPLFINYFSTNTDINILSEKIICNIKKNIYSNNDLYKKFKWVANYVFSFIENSNDKNLKKYLDEIRNL